MAISIFQMNNMMPILLLNNSSNNLNSNFELFLFKFIRQTPSANKNLNNIIHINRKYPVHELIKRQVSTTFLITLTSKANLVIMYRQDANYF